MFFLISAGLWRTERTAFRACLAALSLLLAVRPHAGLALDPQKEIAQYVQQVWQARDGLPQNSVRAITQTPDGYLWLGTEEGLVRFDGVAFTVFDRSNTPGLKNNFITALLADRKGRLWVGMEGGGLGVLEKGSLVPHVTRDGPLTSQVWALCEAGDGGVWAGSRSGLWRLHGNGKADRYGREAGLPHDSVSTLFLDSRGVLWAGTPGGGLARFDEERFTVFSVREGLANDRVASISEDPEGALWIGTYGGGVSRLHKGEFTTFPTAGGLLVYSTLVDRDGNVWAGTRNGGLQRLRHGAFQAFTVKEGLSSDVVYRILEDREGSLWAGTIGGGLNRFGDGKLATLGVPEGLPRDWVISVTQDSQGDLWIATEGGGVSHVQSGRVTRYTVKEGLSSDVVTALWAGRGGVLWAGTIGGGLNRILGGKITAFRTSEGLSDDRVTAVFEDGSGTLWAGTRDGRLNHLLENGRFVTLSPPENAGITCLAEDAGGNLWLGTRGAGLCRLAGEAFTCYSARQGLPNDIVLSVLPDADGSVWAGTSGGGLARFSDGAFTAYTVKSGLQDDTVFSILDDGRGSLWMSCNKGIFRVSRRDLEDVARGKLQKLGCVSYGIADGMRSAECSGGTGTTAWKGRDGKLFFSTLKGVVVADPERVVPNALPPPVIVERVIADGSSLDLVRPPRLAAGTRSVEIQYTALSFVAPEKVRFKYRLEGFDEEWVDAGKRRAAFYTNLPPGPFRFRVMAANNDGVWNETGATAELSIAPFFVQTWLFYLLCALAAGTAGLALHRLRVRGLRARNALLAERNLLAQEIHDDISQIMTGILHQLEAAMETSASNACRPYIERSIELARKGIIQARRTIRGLRSPVCEGTGVAEALRRASEALTKGTAVRVLVEEHGARAALPEGLEGELFRIGQEAVTNAIRHGHARQIEIDFV
ncbi:MAG: histidine kinase, partial [Acidobacteria bacterium]|nr:histidine kinase [Acidobacteriota bacterium]